VADASPRTRNREQTLGGVLAPALCRAAARHRLTQAMQSSIDYLRSVAKMAMGRCSPFILCYHGVSSQPPQPDTHGLFVTTAQFEEQLDFIEGRGYRLVAVSHLWRQMRSGADVSRLASITFDDGFSSAVREAMPILARRGASSSMYVTTGLLGAPHPRVPETQIMTSSQVLELQSMGMEVGAHTVDHPYLPGLPYEDVLDQLSRSRAFLEDLLDRPVKSMAYPFGAFDAKVIRAAGEAGYEIACGCTGPAPWRPLSLPREPIFPNLTKLRLRLKMAGLFGPVHASLGLREAIGRVRVGSSRP
jgi:peptidoglycan/xylan/chitin deacetylase (PgdA/CDA1 family)